VNGSAPQWHNVKLPACACLSV